MSCNGCRVLRKGCSDSCLLRPCLQWIDTAEAQGHATIFVAKFFGRAGLMNFISNVPDSERASLFRSLLFEACGRTINPVNGAVGLLATGNWGLCQAAVDTVLRGGTLRVLQDIHNHRGLRDVTKRGRTAEDDDSDMVEKLDLCLGGGEEGMRRRRRRAATPSEESEMTSDESGCGRHPRLLNLFV